MLLSLKLFGHVDRHVVRSQRAECRPVFRHMFRHVVRLGLNLDMCTDMCAGTSFCHQGRLVEANPSKILFWPKTLLVASPYFLWRHAGSMYTNIFTHMSTHMSVYIYAHTHACTHDHADSGVIRICILG